MVLESCNNLSFTNRPGADSQSCNIALRDVRVVVRVDTFCGNEELRIDYETWLLRKNRFIISFCYLSTEDGAVDSS